ncbi:MAG: hypothetical protein KF724_08795 [Phycisphaeraceae bacterium]|nr:hypothetical protein [Phycisphaeraceae bacterium]
MAGGDSAVPIGAMTPEQIAEQAERDLAEFQRMSAARRGTGATGGTGGREVGVSMPPAGGSSGSEAGGLGSNQSDRVTPAGAIGSGPELADALGTGAGGARNASDNRSTGAVAVDRDLDGRQWPDSGGTPPRRVPETPDALAATAAALYRDATREDTPLRSLMAIAALSIAEPDRPFNAEAIPDLTEDERRVLARFHGFCRDLGRQLAGSDDPEAVARAVERLSHEMRGARRLRIPRGELCTQVDGFGVFRAIEPREFVAHSGARFALYFEVDGYRSVELGAEGWKTELSVELSILSERDGVPVWRRDWQTMTDLVATQRKDFFVTHTVTIPDALSVGAYALKIRVRDEQTGALAEHSVPFRMVAAAARPGSSSGPATGGAPTSPSAPNRSGGSLPN